MAILPQWIPELISTEDSAETNSKQFYSKAEHVRSTRSSFQATRNWGCSSTKRNIAKPTDNNQRSNRSDWTIIDYLQIPVQGLLPQLHRTGFKEAHHKD